MTVPRTKKPKQRKIYITEKELQQIKEQLADGITNKAMLLTACAFADELKIKNDEKIVKCIRRVERYAGTIDQHITKINDFSKAIKNQTGIDWGKW